MIYIEKRAEPESLKKARLRELEKGSTPAEAYASLGSKAKREVRNALIYEQGHLCAYCMKRISVEREFPTIPAVRIEHWMPRNPEPFVDLHQGLDYNNLLLACSGNEAPKKLKRKMIDFTCDKHRGNINIVVNPTDQSTLDTIYYLDNGEIHSSDPQIEIDLTKTLNLNSKSSNLIASRKAVLDTLFDEIQEIPDDELLDYLTYVLEDCVQFKEYKDPFVGILIWWIKEYVMK